MSSDLHAAPTAPSRPAPAATEPTERIRPRASLRAFARRSGVNSALVVVSLVFLLPFLWALLTAVKPFTEAFTYPPTWSFTPTGNSFRTLWRATDFVSIFENTIVVAVCTTIVSVGIAAPAAYAMARSTSRVGPWLLILALVFRALPRFAVVLPFYDIAQKLDLYDTDTMLIIALVAVNQPFTLWLLRNFFAGIPREIDEAAEIDGCGPFQAFFRVVLPLTTPGLATAGIFTLLLAYQEYLIPLALTQTNAQTISVFVTSIGTKQNTNSLQTLAAANVALALPVVVIALFAQRYLVRGLTAGAVKS